MAVPKRKSSKARKNKRRSNVWKISVPGFSKCSQCGELKALRWRLNSLFEGRGGCSSAPAFFNGC